MINKWLDELYERDLVIWFILVTFVTWLVGVILLFVALIVMEAG